MDDIRRLENQISQLQRELDEQNREMNRMRRQDAEANKRRLEEYEKQMRNGLNQHDKSVQKEYERLLREYQNSLSTQIESTYLQTNSDYQRLRRSIEETERLWKDKNKQLESMVSELKKNADHKDEVGEQEVNKYMAEAGIAQMDVERKPHEKFFPRRINAFRTAIDDASNMAKQGLREAAIAIFISARSGLNRLGFDVDERYGEWSRQYEILSSKLELMDIKLKDECSDWIKYALEEDKVYEALSDEEKEQAQTSITYWSSGEYDKALKRIEELNNELALVDDLGPMEYLKREDSFGIDEIKEVIVELDKMNAAWDHAATLYKARYSAACERADWGENIIDFLEGEINLRWNERESHFKYADEETAGNPQYLAYMGMQYGETYEKEDTRQWLELVFTNSMDTVVFVYIVPYEKDSKVENRIVLYIDYNGVENEEYSRHIYQHVCESIHLDTDDGTINFATDVNQLRTNTNTTLRETGKSIETKMRRIR